MKSWYKPVNSPRMARGAFSLTYSGLMALAAPTPTPEMKRPMYMGARWPEAAAWRTTPSRMNQEQTMRHHLRPKRSVSGEAIRAPRKQPACRVETMFADRLAEAAEVVSPRP